MTLKPKPNDPSAGITHERKPRDPLSLPWGKPVGFDLLGLTRQSPLARAVSQETDRRRELERLERYMAGTKAGMFGLSYNGEGSYWLGIRPARGEDGAYLLWEKIYAGFLHQNILGAVCKHHRNAVVGRDMDYTFTGLSETEAKAAEDGIEAWYIRQGVQETIQDAVTTSLWAKLEGEGRRKDKTSSLLRYYISRRALTPDPETGALGLEVIPTEDVGQSLNRAVRLMHPAAADAGIIRGEDGEDVAGYYRYSAKNALGLRESYIEISIVDYDLERLGWGWQKGSAPFGEPIGDTIVQIRRGRNWEEIVGEANYPLGGRLTMFEMSRDPLVSEDAFAQNNALNTNWTYLQHNGEAAFTWRVFTNVAPPEEGEDFPIGSGAASFAMGAPIYGDPNDPDKVTGYSPAGVQQFTAGSTDPYTTAIKACEYAIYDIVSQLHRLISGDATSSGVSRQQALGDYKDSLRPTETQVNLMGTWLYSTALAFASWLQGRPGYYEGVDVNATAQIQTAAPTVEELRLYIEQHNAGVFDIEELMRRSGITDVNTMLEKIEEERVRKIAQAREMLEAQGRDPNDPNGQNQRDNQQQNQNNNQPPANTPPNEQEPAKA